MSAESSPREAPAGPDALVAWRDSLRLQGELMDGLEVGLCAFDTEDRVVWWNRTFLMLFPEHDGHVHEGESYRDNLRRFYSGRLTPEELPMLERFVEAGIARHHAQLRPYEFTHAGRTVRVSSLPVPGLGRIRTWRATQPVAGSGTRAPGVDPAEGWALLEAAPEPLVLCDLAGGSLLWANAAFRALVGRTAGKDLLGQTMAALYARQWAGDAMEAVALREEGLAALRENLRYAGAPFELPLPGQRHCRVVSRKVNDDRVLYAFTEITELKRYEASLQLTLDNAARGILHIDAQDRVILYNRAALELLDLPEDLLASRPLMVELVRFQDRRGDFGSSRELLPDMAAADLARDVDDKDWWAERGHYLRRTRNGKVLEIATELLPGGGAVRTFSDVTAYVRTQEALSEQQRSLKVTLDSMAQGILAADASGRLVFWNRRVQDILDLPDDLLVSGMPFTDLVVFQGERGDFGPGFRLVDAVARGYVAAGDRIAPLQGPRTYQRRTPDGRVLEVHTLPTADGGVVRTFMDITERVQAEEALAQEQALLGALVSSLPDRVWVKDPQGAYRLSNAAHQRFHGLTEDAILGRTAGELWGPEEEARHMVTDVQALASHEPVHFEARALGPDGTLRDMELLKIGMHDGDRCLGVLGIARDITERKRAEAALIAAREEALAASRAKSRFLSSMSHEIRTPMNAILGMLTLLRGTGLGERQEDYASKAQAAGQSLLGLLNDVLDYSKIEAGKMQLECRPFSLEEVLAGLAVILSAGATAKPVEVLYDLDPEVPDALVGDAMRLQQILINLGGNAVKFTERGEVVLRTRLAWRSATHASIAFEVMDSGIGISEEEQQLLFQDYVQAGTDTARRFGGTGLGLGICRRLTELMDSRLQLSSEPGRGSCFSFTLDLPLAPVPATDSAPHVPARRVLVVDDNPLARETLVRLASSLGWQAQAASGGEDALEQLQHVQAAGQAFDAVFMDWHMPGMDGPEAARRLRGLAGARPLPIVMVTTSGDREPAGDTYDQLLVKPVTAAMLRDSVERALSGPRARATAAPTHPLAGLRLLVAEDNPVNQQIARELLVGQGAQVDIVEDGAEAVVKLAADRRYDAVLMDMLMPRMGGLDATRAIRAMPGFATVPIIAMTANAMDSDREACLAAGMNDHVGKPVVLAQVIETVLRHTGRTEAPAPEPVQDTRPLLDRTGAISRLGCDDAFFDRLVPKFRDNLLKAGRELQAADRPPHEDLCRLMHTLKGMAGTMGAERLAVVAGLAETQLREGGPGTAVPAEEVGQTIALTLEALGAD